MKFIITDITGVTMECHNPETAQLIIHKFYEKDSNVKIEAIGKSSIRLKEEK